MTERKTKGRNLIGVRLYARPDQAIWIARGGRSSLAADRPWAAGLPAGSLRLRQDHDAAAHRRILGAFGGRDPCRRPAGVLKEQNLAARAAQDVDDLPELRAVAAHDGRGKYRLRAATRGIYPAASRSA